LLDLHALLVGLLVSFDLLLQGACAGQCLSHGNGGQQAAGKHGSYGQAVCKTEELGRWAWGAMVVHSLGAFEEFDVFISRISPKLAKRCKVCRPPPLRCLTCFD
jgi:hypothetical protein